MKARITDKDIFFWRGEQAIQRLKITMPSKSQTKYNQRDIKKRGENNERVRNS